MARKKGSKPKPRRTRVRPATEITAPEAGEDARSSAERSAEEQMQGPPPGEVLREPTDMERAMLRESEEHSATSPKLTGGDPDADWRRAHLSGEEAVGGSVATPDQNVVDQLGDALGVSRGTDEEVRSSAEILEERDARRGHNEE